MFGIRPFSSSEHTGYRFGFNGMEKDDEVKGNGNSLDFGARVYDPRLGRWLTVDPMEMRSPGASPYNYCFNNPIIYSDPDGEYPELEITNEVTGYTHARVYGRGEVNLVIVPTYKMIVWDVNDQGERKKLGEFNVTRDGWYNQGTNTKTKTDHLVNRTTEPATGDVTVSATATVDYGNTYGAYALDPIDAVETPADWATFDDGLTPVPSDASRADPAVATSVMIHVGGYYVNKAAENKIGGTYGCFGVVHPDQVSGTVKEAQIKAKEARAVLEDPTYSTTMSVPSSNSEQNRLVGAVNSAVKLAKERKEKSASNVKATIRKRDKVKSEHTTKPR